MIKSERTIPPFLYLILSLIIVAGSIAAWSQARSTRLEIEQVMITEARMIAATLDTEKIARLQGAPEDLQGPDYRYLRDQIVRVQNTNSRYRYLYLMGQRPGQQPFFFMGTAPENSDDYSPPGQIYSEDSPTLNHTLTAKEAAVSPPFTDRWGTWVSALVPVMDTEKGVLLAVFGMDYDAGDWRMAILRRSLTPVLLTSLALVLVTITFFHLRLRQNEIDRALHERMEMALREMEKKSRVIVENVSELIWCLDQKGDFTFVSPSFSRVLGVDPATLIGKNMQDIVHPDDFPACQLIIQEILIQKKAHQGFEIRMHQANGEWCWQMATGSPMPDEQNSHLSVVVVSRDITAQKRSEAALKASEERYSSLFNRSIDWVYIADFDGHFLDANPVALEALGYKLEELSTLTFASLLSEDQLPLAYKTTEEIRSTGRQIRKNEYRVSKKDGGFVFVETQASILLQDGKPFAIQGIGRDITERKKAEEALRKSEAKLQDLFENMPNGYYRSTHEGRFVEANPAFVKMLGYASKEELLEVNITEDVYIQPSDRSFYINELPNSEFLDSNHYESYCLKTKDGRIIHVEDNARYIKDEQGNILFHEGICRDITERKQTEAEKDKLELQLLQAQKMESVGRLAGGVAHDYNNMLGVIRGHADLALYKTDENHPLHLHLKEIRNAAQRSVELTQQLLAFARQQTIAPKIMDLNRSVTATLQMLRLLLGEEIELVWLPGADACSVMIDPSQFDQLLMNLCVNARDAIDGVGRISIETGRVLLDEAYCATNTFFVPGEYALLSVSDTGCGMDRETQAKIFEPFFTTKGVGQGTGLGLATVYGIIKQNNGFINVYSEPGQGSTFRIYLPRHLGSAVEDSVEEIGAVSRHNTETILVVEDERALLEINTNMLQDLGYRVLSAATPAEAMDLAEEFAGTIDLLMTDVVMPGMNGRELAGHILKSNPGIRCLYMSGYTANVISHHGVLDEGVHFIQKPFSLNDMAKKIRETFE